MGNEIEKGIRMIEENRAQAHRVVDARYDELLDEACGNAYAGWPHRTDADMEIRCVCGTCRLQCG